MASSGILLFDRERLDHPWRGALADPPADPGKAWIAINWRMDSRVPLEREEADLLKCAHFLGATDFEDWWAARARYFREEICHADSAYLREPNRFNFIPFSPAGFDRLVHVGSLNAMARRIAQGAAGERTADLGLEFFALTGAAWPFEPLLTGNIDQATDRLAASLLDRGTQAVKEAAGLLTEALGPSQPPWWACFAQEIQNLLAGDDTSLLCSALGLGHHRDGDWLFVWSYSVAEAGPLFRPTVIEADDSPYHYPSPPGYDWGITMPLDPDLPACREVLHRPLERAASNAGCTGRLLRLQNYAGQGDRRKLGALRQGHRERLRREFQVGGLVSWLERHPELDSL